MDMLAEALALLGAVPDQSDSVDVMLDWERRRELLLAVATAPRPPLANFRTQAGEPMEMGAVVRIDERNGEQALGLLHDAYHVLGRGYHDDGQWYGPTYSAIADFLYPDIVDIEAAPPAIEGA